MRVWIVSLISTTLFVGLSACGAESSDVCVDEHIYASEVVAFVPGDGAGFGQSSCPEDQECPLNQTCKLALGAPEYGPPESSSLDVVSLGVGGYIDLGFGEHRIVDGEGPDFVIWENTFWVGGNPESPFAEHGEVSVSEDGKNWKTFGCIPTMEFGNDSGCAGWRPRQNFDACKPDSSELGGDKFDLAELGLSQARYVRIRDLSKDGVAPSAGFDLDAVGILNSSL